MLHIQEGAELRLGPSQAHRKAQSLDSGVSALMRSRRGCLNKLGPFSTMVDQPF